MQMQKQKQLGIGRDFVRAHFQDDKHAKAGGGDAFSVCAECTAHVDYHLIEWDGAGLQLYSVMRIFEYDEF